MKPGTGNAEKYVTHHAVEFEPNDRRGYTVIKVLPFLWGRPCDDVTMAYIQALRPSAVRITEGEQTCDSYTWRVTVLVDAHNFVQRIEQEVELGLPEPFGCGWELEDYIRTGEHHPLPEGQGLAIINMRAVRKLELKDK